MSLRGASLLKRVRWTVGVLAAFTVAACSASPGQIAPASPASQAPSAGSALPSASGVSLKEILRQPVGEDHVETVAFSPDGLRLAIGAEDGTVAVLKLQLQPGEDAVIRKLHVGQTTGLAWSPDGKRLLTAAGDGSVRVSDPESLQVAYSVTAYPTTYPSVAWSPDGQRFALAQGRNTVQLFEAKDGTLVDSFQVGDVRTRALLWLPGGEVAASDETGRVAFFAAGQAKPVRIFQPDVAHKAVNSMSLSPDGQTLAIAYDDGALLLVNPATAKLIRELPKGRQSGTVSWSPNGKLLALTSVSFDLKILDAGGALIARDDVGYDTNGTAWSPDGRYLAMGADDKTLRVYELSPPQTPDRLRPTPPSFMGR